MFIYRGTNPWRINVRENNRFFIIIKKFIYKFTRVHCLVGLPVRVGLPQMVGLETRRHAITEFFSDRCTCATMISSESESESERKSSLESIFDLVRFRFFLDDNCLDLESCFELIVLLVYLIVLLSDLGFLETLNFHRFS